jgi:DNA helicase-2/ATP-dependent DNA helicase PcrA
MIPLDAFLPAVCAAVPRFQDSPPDPRQAACILAPRATPLMVVAGPGSGKTTVLVLRSLRLVFVDGLLPESVVITTFTRKAADELRSRLIDWGLSLLDHLSQNSPSARPHGLRQWLETVDLNRFITGTLDSICEDTLTTYRDPGDAPPVLVEGFVGNALLAREGLWRSGALDSPALDSYLAQFTFGGRTPRNFGETTALCRTVVDRLVHDQVDVAAFEAGMPYTPGRQVVVGALRGYRSYMEQTNRMDFGALEEVFLARLSQGRLKRFSSAIQAVVVDEYQDTNPLQESIYFELVQQTRPSLTIVGDDDQALYRFRGATVELFCDFPRRLHAAVPAMPGVRTEHLVNNYRSTPEIASFVNDYVAYDSAYAGARVQPPKPPIVAQRRASGIPVLGLFRPDAATLARDLASFLHAVFRGDGRPVTVGGQTIQVSGHPEGGDVGDAVVLAHTVQEFGNRFGSRPPRPRLPFLLRQELADPRRRIGVFNPGGRALRDIPEVQQLLGLVLLCIDPPASPSSLGTQQASARLRSDARHYLTVWAATGCPANLSAVCGGVAGEDQPDGEGGPLAGRMAHPRAMLQACHVDAVLPG